MTGDRRNCRDLSMYSFVYWAGVTALVLWTAFSAYSAVSGM
jgi:hypothetical protein